MKKKSRKITQITAGVCTCFVALYLGAVPASAVSGYSEETTAQKGFIVTTSLSQRSEKNISRLFESYEDGESYGYESESKNSRYLTSTNTSDGRKHLAISGLSTKNIWSYPRTTVKVSGITLSVSGFTANGTEYIPFRAAASVLGGSYNYNSSLKTSTMYSSGLELSATDGCFVTYANGRALFSESPNVIMSDGRIYIPAKVFAKATGMTLSSNGSHVIISGKYSPLISADKFYRSDEILWLARIIHAESNGEPLIGQIAVGNVVLNRVKSSYYPNTIYGVIFDRKYGVQFSPILNGSIYNTPSYTATLAAKICLDGYDVSDGTFFFLEPRLATSSWIPQSRDYAFTIGNHDFYK